MTNVNSFINDINNQETVNELIHKYQPVFNDPIGFKDYKYPAFKPIYTGFFDTEECHVI